MGKKNIVKVKEGIILYATYHLFDFLRQISLFQQIRNLSKCKWEWIFWKNNSTASKREHYIAWKTNPPFVFSSLFSEIWVLSNILFSIIGCILVANISCDILSCVFLFYAVFRTFEIFVYQINVLLFDPIKCGISKYRIKSATRTVILLVCNIIEYILWFSVVYIFLYKTKNPDYDTMRLVLESTTTLANITSPEDFSVYEKGIDVALVVHVESVIGIFMNIICLARFISLLPPVKTIDNN